MIRVNPSHLLQLLSEFGHEMPLAVILFANLDHELDSIRLKFKNQWRDFGWGARLRN